jgi:AcrR family transcriptional regulator
MLTGRSRSRTVSVVTTTDLRRDRLVAAALGLFADRPMDEISAEDIAAAAGVAKGLIFYHFGSKAGLVRHVARLAAEELHRVSEPDPAVPEPERGVRALTAWLRYVRAHRGLYRWLADGAGARDPALADIVATSRAEGVDRVVRAVAPSGIEAVPPELVLAAHGWIGLVQATTLAWLDGGARDEAAVARFLSDSCWWLLGRAGQPVAAEVPTRPASG